MWSSIHQNAPRKAAMMAIAAKKKPTWPTKSATTPRRSRNPSAGKRGTLTLLDVFGRGYPDHVHPYAECCEDNEVGEPDERREQADVRERDNKRRPRSEE